MNDTSAYRAFLEQKTQSGALTGFDPVFMPSFLFDFQAALTEWSVRKGRCLLLEDCGLGKTPQELVWGENVVRYTNGRVLLLTPLAVAPQIVAEAEKFGIEVHRSVRGELYPGINISNYERLHLFNPTDFAAVICDESGILKSFDGVMRRRITEFMRHVQYRLLATATAAPNDYMELGTSSEALGELGYMDMLTRFFKSQTGSIAASNFRRGDIGADRNTDAKWRFKGHAEEPFWRWVCSWARAIRRPSDLGFDDGAFVLPELIEREHVVESTRAAEGMLFNLPAADLREQREERRRTISERCERVAELVDGSEPALVWCHLNEEGNLLERLIDGAVQVSGKDSDDAKEEKLLAFARGEIQKLVTKPTIGAWGLNFQRCAHTTLFPSHSFEQYYQCIRRFYRFGQTEPVTVDIVTTEGERGVMANLQRKARGADRMFTSLVAAMNSALSIDRAQRFTKREELPAWL